MNPLILGPIIEMAGRFFDKYIPDPEKAAAAKLKFMEMQQSGELAHLHASLQRDLAQAEVNKAEAASANVFVSGWRPAIGWVCALALAYQYLIRPLAPAFMDVPPMPSLDESLWELVFIMMGFGGLRSYEKQKGLVK